MSSASPTTYGELIDTAQRQVAWAAAQLATDRIADRATAETAFTAYRRLLVVAGEHLLFLVGGPHRLEGHAAAVEPEYVDRPALRLARELLDLKATADDARARVSRRGHPVREWTAAARTLGAAQDLVATHHDPRGWDRTVSAGVLESGAARAYGYGEIADLVLGLAGSDRDLALRAAQAGVPWARTMRRLPSLDVIEAAARELRREVGLRGVPDARPPLRGLSVARPGVRVGPPDTELVDRLSRLRLGAWTLARHPRHASAADLVDYAAAAVILHAHVIAHGDQLGITPSLLADLQERRIGWARQHQDLAGLSSGVPVTPGLRADVRALPALAQATLPLTRGAAGVHAAGQPRWDLDQTLTALDACTNIAIANATTLDAIASRGTLFIDARQLPGDRVSDDPGLVTAKLDGRLVPADCDDVTPIVEAYQPLAERRIDTSPTASELDGVVAAPSRAVTR